MIIRGNTVGTPTPRTDFNQENPAKADYLKGRENLIQLIADAKSAGDNASTAAGNAQTAADNANTAAGNAQATANSRIPLDGSLPMTGTLDMGNNKIHNVVDPVDDTDAANKKYVDEKRKTLTVTLPADNWVDNSNIVAVEGVTADCDVVVSSTSSSRAVVKECGVYADSQSDGTLTFKCEEAPAVDVTVGVMIFV